MKLVLFDFDGTLTTKDTMWSFLHYHAGTVKFLLNLFLLGPMLIAFAVRLISAEKAKMATLKRFLGGKTMEEIRNSGQKYCDAHFERLLNNKLLIMLRNYQKELCEVCVVTASCREWVGPICEKLNVRLIATELQYNNGVFHGALKSANCKGEEKVRRIKQVYNLTDYSEVIAYGNKPDDLPMLKLADRSYVI